MSKKTKIILGVVATLAVAGAVYYFFFYKKDGTVKTPTVSATEIPVD